MAGHPDNAPKAVSVLGIIGLVFGCAGLAIAFIPCVGFLGMPLSAAGLVLAIIGVGLSASNKKTGMAVPLIALIISGVALALPFFVLKGTVEAGLDAVAEGLNRAQKWAEDEKKVQEAANATKVSPAELAKEFKTDKAAATTKYEGKVLEVSGEIAEVGEPKEGEISVSLKGEGDGDKVQCVFGALHKGDLKKGERVKVKGKCAGALVGDTPTLTHCILEK